MKLRSYFPSTQFSLIVVSLFVSGGLVYAAEVFTSPQLPAELASVPPTMQSTGDASNTDWEATLSAIQSEESSSSLPTPPDQNTVSSLVQSAQSQNLTASAGKTLLIDLENAQGQGLGADTPTQNRVVSDVLGQLPIPTPTITYAQSDLTVVPESVDADRAYGNAIITVLQKYPNASMGETLQIIGNAVNGDNSGLGKLTGIAAEYHSLAKALAAIPVPEVLAPYHLELVNDLEQMAETYPSMVTLETDPLRSLQALQTYKTLDDQVQSMFINIAQALGKDDILWNKSEPGALWAVLVPGGQ